MYGWYFLPFPFSLFPFFPFSAQLRITKFLGDSTFDVRWALPLPSLERLVVSWLFLFVRFPHRAGNPIWSTRPSGWVGLTLFSFTFFFTWDRACLERGKKVCRYPTNQLLSIFSSAFNRIHIALWTGGVCGDYEA